MGAAGVTSTINRRDFDFQIFEVLDVERLTRRPAYADHDRLSMSAALDVAQQIARDKFATHYAVSDKEEPRIEDGKVRLPAQVADALDAFVEAGFMNADRPFEEDGQSLPFTVYQACLAFFQAANVATSSYNFLTISGASVIRAFGTDAQRARYMGPMLSGRFLGTMCLSEPHAGSGLADIRTKAVPRPDGTYRLKGTKMWISGGEHELSDNIVHLVLARIEGAPPGTRGISLFVVPRRRVAEDGAVGSPNGVTLVGLNHKMGYRGCVNTLLNFGEAGDCEAELVGEPNRGLSYMFHMMNEARISVGFGAAALGGAGYLYSLDYARSRLQGRLPGAKDPTAPPVAIVEHADVRRMLLAQKSYVEGATALCLYAASLVDDLRTAETDDARRTASRLLEILTPIVKSWPSEFCLEANKLAIQVLGGYGYTRDFPVEQLYRDNRLNLIHEGTHGIQALDLVGRKIRMDGGTVFDLLIQTIRDDVARAGRVPGTAAFVAKLEAALAAMVATTRAMRSEGRDARIDAANATLYLDTLGHVVVAWMWLRQVAVALEALRRSPQDDADFYGGKVAAARYFFDYELEKLSSATSILGRTDTLLADLDQRCL